MDCQTRIEEVDESVECGVIADEGESDEGDEEKYVGLWGELFVIEEKDNGEQKIESRKSEASYGKANGFEGVVKEEREKKRKIFSWNTTSRD